MCDVMTTFLPQGTRATLSPFNDPNRVYSDEHDFVVYGCTSGPETRTFQILDLPQRRWYELSIPSSTWPTPPLSEEEELNVQEILVSRVGKQPKPFNTIRIDQAGNANYEMAPSIGIPLRKQPIVSKCAFPTAKDTEITQKHCLFRAVDVCVWKGVNCFYKQLEFDDLVPQMMREISSRESLLRHFNLTDHLQLSAYGVNPILAVVVHGDPPLLQGVLLADAGCPIQSVLPGHVTLEHLASLVRTVKHLLEANVVHGDICERNVCMSGSLIQLIDFGERRPKYNNDVVALGELLLWCMERMTSTDIVKKKVSRAAVELLARQDPDAALAMLEDTDDGLSTLLNLDDSCNADK